MKNEIEDGTLLGTFTYDEFGEPTQTFELPVSQTSLTGLILANFQSSHYVFDCFLLSCDTTAAKRRGLSVCGTTRSFQLGPHGIYLSLSLPSTRTYLQLKSLIALFLQIGYFFI